MLDNFFFRDFYVIVFELLDMNLFKYISRKNYTVMPMAKIKSIAVQLLKSLCFMKKLRIIHCDLKPENINFTDDTYNRIKVVDFGSSCTSYKTGFRYVQSRFYRCPEIVMGLPYDCAVDMWSFGCIISELALGRPIFPSRDENEHLEMIV